MTGKFPLDDYKDLYENSKTYHTLMVLSEEEPIKVKITGFDNSCKKTDLNKFGNCKITVEKLEEQAATGGRKKRF